MTPYVRPSYNIFILDLSSIRYFFEQGVAGFANQMKLYPDEYESAFDWCVREALTNVFALPGTSVRVDGHHRHDIYKCVYDHIGREFEFNLNHVVALNQIRIMPCELKVLVAGTNVVIAQGVPRNARL